MGVKSRLVAIHRCQGVGWKTIRQFFLYDATLQSIFFMDKETLMRLFGLRKMNAEKFVSDLHSCSIEDILRAYKQQNIQLVTIFDEEYPPLLKEIYDPPWVLYCIGDLNLFSQFKCISVVGTRNPSGQGLESIERLVAPMIAKDWIVISGLAKGIDTRAHELSIREGGKTIAVLGSGFKYIYPSGNRQLARLIARHHLLTSEYPPNQKPTRWQFPERNRIISGLSLGTLVVEAKERSGSLITADQALEQGREVFAVPGSILSEQSIGTNRLIQQGAKLVLKAEDILSELTELE